ncbi:MAG: GIY-YIG nuclease family protein [Candidatus Staskawiczbacteria bacterium]
MEKFIFINEKNFSELPKTNGVYCFLNEKETIYIGKAINIQNRVKNHFQQPSYKDHLYIDKVNKIGYIETSSEIEALILEANLIKKTQPKFNVVWRDDKNYFYVAISKDKIPIVYITHQKNETAEYIGPFVEGTALKMTLKFLRKVFPYYTSKTHPKIPTGSRGSSTAVGTKCTYCHLDLCPGPRLFEARLDSPKGEAANLIKEYKKNIKKLILILEGKCNAALSSLKKEMATFSKQNNFEKAGKIRDKIYSLQHVMAHASVINKETISSWDKTQKILQVLTNLDKKISKIECYDVSNIQGKSATGSMAVFINGIADKKQYKKFKIKGNSSNKSRSQSDRGSSIPKESGPNDIAMLEEIITRRLLHKDWTYPEIILIDGGIAQLNIAIKVKNSNPEAKSIKIISIAKRNKDLYIEGRDGFIPLKSLPREIYNLVLQLDEEAHRFAITYHKKLRKNNLLGN